MLIRTSELQMMREVLVQGVACAGNDELLRGLVGRPDLVSQEATHSNLNKILFSINLGGRVHLNSHPLQKLVSWVRHDDLFPLSTVLLMQIFLTS